MALLLVLIFIVVPLAELYVIIQVGQLIGILPTLGVLLLDSIVGSMLLRSQGRAVWRRFNETMRAGRVPHREAVDGALVIFGGALLLTPGFLTDLAGLFLLAPPTRALARRAITGALARRTLVGAVGRQWRAQDPPRHASYVDGTATEQGTDIEGAAPEHRAMSDPRAPRLKR